MYKSVNENRIQKEKKMRDSCLHFAGLPPTKLQILKLTLLEFPPTLCGATLQIKLIPNNTKIEYKKSFYGIPTYTLQGYCLRNYKY